MLNRKANSSVKKNENQRQKPARQQGGKNLKSVIQPNLRNLILD